MRNKLFIDFETRSFIDLKEHGAWIYGEDHTTDIICMAYFCQGIHHEVQIWIPGNEVPEEFLNKNLNIVARNALFEYSIMHHVLVPKYKFPNELLEISRWECTRAMSLSLGLPGSLADCAKTLNVKTQKLESGNDLINKYSKSARDRKTGNKYFRDIPMEDMDRWIEYNKTDVQADFECYEKMYEQPNVRTEREVFLLDFRHNIKGLNIDYKNLVRVRNALIALTEQAEIEMEKIGVNVRSPQQMQDHFLSKGFELENCQKDTIENLIGNTGSDKLDTLLNLRLFLGKASVKKFHSFYDRVDTDLKLRYFFRYYGGHTGRYSSVGAQLHNMAKTKTSVKEINKLLKAIESIKNYSEFIEAGKKILPGLIIPEKDKVFVMGDFNAIESRGAAYLAGEDVLLDQYRDNEDPYKILATQIFHTHVNNITDKQRDLGKMGVLSCQYGTGANTFRETCLKYGMDISEDLAEQTIYTYRSMYSNIRNFWYEIEKKFKKAYENEGIPFSLGKRLKVVKKRNYIKVILPSFREMYYHRFDIDETEQMSYWNHSRNMRVKLWGGMLLENITQAMCRDILVDRMFECEKQGLEAVLHVHDELVCQVYKEDKKEAKKKFDSIMNTAPGWLPGFPLKTESEICMRYHK